ncbi:MAG: T9SS type A sorting domain-containing protein [Bacteroidota bacterium]|nr:T9SS type A sorting domain-containing protein [Bacteroidota bacterium]
MKNLLLATLLFAAAVTKSQPVVQPVSSGDYWTTKEYINRLSELANTTTFPTTINFANGYAAINSFKVNRIIGANEIHWDVGALQNVSDFYLELSHDLKTFERAGLVRLIRKEGGTNYVFRHTTTDENLVYYRLALVSYGIVMAYTPAIQMLDEEYTTKVFPTLVKGSTFYIQTAQQFDKLQVINSANQSVYEKGLDKQSGTITIGLPSLPAGIYFVRLLAMNKHQHVQRIMVE